MKSKIPQEPPGGAWEYAEDLLSGDPMIQDMRKQTAPKRAAAERERMEHEQALIERAQDGEEIRLEVGGVPLDLAHDETIAYLSSGVNASRSQLRVYERRMRETAHRPTKVASAVATQAPRRAASSSGSPAARRTSSSSRTASADPPSGSSDSDPHEPPVAPRWPARRRAIGIPGTVHRYVAAHGLTIDKVRWCSRCAIVAPAIDSYQCDALDRVGFHDVCPDCGATS